VRVTVRGTLGKRAVHAYLWTGNLIRTYRVIILYKLTSIVCYFLPLLRRESALCADWAALMR
jgi:hypothetical protein